MPLLKKRTTLYGKIETTMGTAITLTGGTDGIANAYDVKIDADMPYNERESPGAFGRLAGTVGAYFGTLDFKVPAIGSGTAGTSPAYAEICHASCGLHETSGVWTPISAGTSQKTATFGVFQDGIRKTLCGAMGSWSLKCKDGETPYFEYKYKGIWIAPTDVAMFAPMYSTVVPPRFAGATLTIGSYTPTCSKFDLNFGTVVDMREDVTNITGYISGIIVDRKVTGSLDPEATNVATPTGDGLVAYDAYGAWLAGTTAALTCTFGASGSGLSISAPVLQYTGIKNGDRNKKYTHDLEFIAAQNGSTPDSEVTITY